MAEADPWTMGNGKMVMTVQNPILYFVVVFWGSQYRQWFLDLLLPSLLSPNNLPALPKSPRHRLLIVTIDEDWKQIQQHPAFLKCRELIDPVHLSMRPPPAHANKYLVMSRGHQKATRHTFQDRACGVFLTPDLVLSDGSVDALYRLALEGKRVVLCAAMRFAQEPCLAEIQALRERSTDQALVLPAQVLADMAIRHMHMETLRYDYDMPFFADRPISFFFRTPDQHAILVHSFSWAPLLVNYGALTEHNEKTLQSWTMDGDYIYQNFGDSTQIYVVQDSDEILLVSFTPQDDFLGYLSHNLFLPRWYLSWPIVKDYWKTHAIRRVKNSHDMDPLKRSILSRGVRIHAQEHSATCWSDVESRANRVLDRVESSPSLIEKCCVGLVKVVEAVFSRPLSYFQQVSDVIGVAKVRNLEFTNQAGVGSYRLVLLGHGVSKGKWYWEISSPNLSAQRGHLRETASMGVVGERHSLVRELGTQSSGWGWRGDGSKIHDGKRMPYGSGSDKAIEVIMVALDMDAGAIWFGRNGEWFEGGDPADAKYPAFRNLDNPVFPAVSSRHGGQGTASMRGAMTPDQWKYPPPAGFQSLINAFHSAGPLPIGPAGEPT
ncbi:MAG: SPRY domain-containing protein [Nitrospirales bacterium]|nr:hypothetical protein [Nitrospirales bacterium]